MKLQSHLNLLYSRLSRKMLIRTLANKPIFVFGLKSQENYRDSTKLNLGMYKKYRKYSGASRMRTGKGI